MRKAISCKPTQPDQIEKNTGGFVLYRHRNFSAFCAYVLNVDILKIINEVDIINTNHALELRVLLWYLERKMCFWRFNGWYGKRNRN
jgi:hypothetical protein